MKDNFGDKVEVGTTIPGAGSVWIDFADDDHPDGGVAMQFTPKKARKFIRKLEQAVSRVEIAQRDAR